MYFRRSPRSWLLSLTLLFGLVALCQGAPFRVESQSNLRPDGQVLWEDYLTTPPSQTLPLNTALPTYFEGPTISVSASNGNSPLLVDRPSAVMPGVYTTCGPESSFQLNLSHAVQGFGAVMEPKTQGKTRFFIEFFTPSYELLFRTNVYSDGGPVYVGGIDPAEQLYLILIYAVDPTTQQRVPFYIGDLEIQMKPATIPLPELPIASFVELDVSPTDTYLHRGFGAKNRSPGTDTASDDHPNCHDLLASFPTLRTGDILLFQRLGASLYKDNVNHLLGVFMATEDLLPSDEFQRLPTAINAGKSYYTGATTNTDSNFETPTNIGQDFLIVTNSFIPVPGNARYVFFSKSIPVAAGAPLKVRINHIQQLPFLNWINALGLVGENADINSDLDGDGLTLIEEFAFGHDPTREDLSPQDFAFPPNGFLSNNRMRIAFGARTGAPVLYHAEFSDNMVEWDRVSNIGILLNDVFENQRAVFAVDDPKPGPQRFGRIVVEYLEPVTF